jgi:hypothetical protein
MQIYLTFDYEIYFGAKTGTVQRCITEPTTMLLDVAEKHGVKMVQFVDVGFLLQLDKQRKKYPALDKDYKVIIDQLELLWKKGQDIQLHIHPHWEDSYYNGTEWIVNPERYKLTDFNEIEISDIVHRYKNKLEEITGKNEIYAFRAGGWCAQPFSQLRSALLDNGIRADSSVFANGHFESTHYSYDFRNAPKLSRWKFDDDLTQPISNGVFTELPISSIFNSPLFYWRLFLLGRINPYMHKPLGDGAPIPAPGQRMKMLTRWTHNTVSVDGYNATLLNRALRQQKRLGNKEMVIIGHPKALSRYGLATLDRFIAKHKGNHQFTTFREQKNTFV